MFTNGLLIGKVMAAAPAVIPYKIISEKTPNYRENHNTGVNEHIEKVNVAINNAARTITRTRLSDKVSSKHVLRQAGLTSLSEMMATASAQMAWKSKQYMDPLGNRLFSGGNTTDINLRSSNSNKIKTPVPGYPNVAINLMAMAWNESIDLQSATTIGSARKAAKTWAKSIQI